MGELLSKAKVPGPRSERRRSTWRQLEKQTAASFHLWLNAGRRDADIVRIQKSVTDFLIGNLTNRGEVEIFASCWPQVLGSSCNDPNTYLDFWNVLAYCHILFLERYRRFYGVLERLYAIGHLPMRDSQVRVLDVGTGPAPCLYALQDFYDQVRAFGEFVRMPDLRPEPLILRCVEQSPAMEWFMHHFSESAFRPGPFGATHKEFLTLDLAELRRASELEYRRSIESDWDDPNSPWVGKPADYKHDLYIFSNFLTTRQISHAAHDQILKIFYWLGPGQQVLIMGSSTKGYNEIYALVDRLASQAHVERIDAWDDLFPCSFDDFSAERVKAQYNAVLEHMLKLHPKLNFPREPKELNELCDRGVHLRGPRNFRVRLYRRTRLAGGRRWRHRPPL